MTDGDNTDNNPVICQAKARPVAPVPKERRIQHQNVVPSDLLEDEFLNSLISSSLPKNYNFEVHKTIWKIEQTNAKRVLLQLPEGLIRFGPVLVDIIVAYFNQTNIDDISIITMGDLTYGACCVDDYLAASMSCDLIVHYAHSCLVPINRLNQGLKYLYIFLDIKFELTHLYQCVKHNFDPKTHHLAIASTIQFLSSVHELTRKLRLENYEVSLPQSRPLSSGEVLGCTAPKLDASVNTILFICDGRFHLEALMIANPKVKAFRYDPYSRKITHEVYAFGQMYDQRLRAIELAAKALESGGTFGFVLGTLGRQGSEKVYDQLIHRLRSVGTRCRAIKVLMPEVVQDNLAAFDDIDVWVQVACPRLSIDWGAAFDKPLLNPYEFIQAFRKFAGVSESKSCIAPENYPMDFYAKNSTSDHTPSHSCLNNPDCECKLLEIKSLPSSEQVSKNDNKF